MTYDLFPAVDSLYNFPPEIRAALALALELRNQVVPMTQTARNNLTGAGLWDGRVIANTTSDRLNRYDAGTSTWVQIPDLIDVTTLTDTARQLTGIRNRAINGAFNVNQRAAVSGTALNPGDFFFDRWQCTQACSPTWTTDGQGSTITLPAGGQIAQTIENANVNPGRYILSHTGTAKMRAWDITGSAPAFAAGPLIVDLPTPNTADITIEFQADGGSSKTVGRVQFEKIGNAGTVADVTPFERRLIGAELELCQRYFYRALFNPSVWVSPAVCVSSLTARFTLRFPRSMRIPPTYAISNLTHFNIVQDAATLVALNASTLLNASQEGATISFTGPSASLTTRQGVFAARTSVAGPGYLDFNAEGGLGY